MSRQNYISLIVSRFIALTSSKVPPLKFNLVVFEAYQNLDFMMFTLKSNFSQQRNDNCNNVKDNH